MTTRKIISSVGVNGSDQFLRLSKVIAATGVCSRRLAEQWISAGRVSINNAETIRVMSYTIKSSDKIFLDGKAIEKGKFSETPRLWAINKLKGELVTRKDSSEEKPMVSFRIEELLKGKLHPTIKGQSATDVNTLKPVAWLDFNTEGLCLLTNNGKLARLMNSPGTGLHRYYRVRVHGLITESKLAGIRRGMTIKGIKYLPMEVTLERTLQTISWVNIKAKESRPHMIQTIFNELHLKPLRIICSKFGHFDYTKVLPKGVEYSELEIDPSLLSLLRDS